MNLVSDFYQRDESLRALIRKLTLNKDAFTLDVGCKKGDTSRAIRENVNGMVGLDLEFHKEWLTMDELIHFVNGNALTLPFLNNSFSMAVAGECLQYIPSPETVIDEICRVLKNDGELVMSFPEGGPFATYLDPYNLALIPKLLYRPSEVKKKFVTHLKAKDILTHCQAGWICKNHYRQGSILFIYVACIIDILQSVRKRLISSGGIFRISGEWIIKPVIKLFFVLMKLDFAIPWSFLSYNNVIRLRKI
ncbi:MAG: hypothetical protein CMB97_00365 [Flavobacteriaceae bacterium]|nr:hypothetical protein [Flavobacteriaceae bacterium]